jgi:CHAT domain-containing protein
MTDAERKALRAELKSRREAIDAEQARLTALRDGIAKHFPAYADLATPGTPPPAALRKLLGAGEVLVMLYPGERGTLVWALAAEGRTTLSASPLTAAQLAGRVAEARRMLDLGAAGRTPPPLQPELMHALYRDLLGPLEPVLANAKTLIVATQGPLGSLPFAALVSTPPQAGAPVAWLARRMAVVQVPTASSLLALRRSPPAPAPRAVIGFGDPMFDPARGTMAPGAIRHLALARVAAAGSTAPVPAAVAAVATAAGAAIVAGAAQSSAGAATRNLASFDIESGFRYEDMPPLPETRAELLALVAALSGDAKTDLFLGERATRRAVIDAPLLDRRVVAFATHGLMPGEVPGVSKPALALAGVAPGSAESPLLTLDDVLALRLNAQWVVLSACNTAAGDAEGGAMSGLVRGFFFAGARSVLATHWAVESASAEALVSATFRQAARGAAGRAQALREAQLAMIDGQLGEGRWTHPFYWAPYALFGDPAR